MEIMDGAGLPGINNDMMEMNQPVQVEQPEQVDDSTVMELESINLVFDLENQTQAIYPSYYDFATLKNGQDILNEIGDLVVQEYQEDLASRSEWEENVATYIKLFTSFMPPKTIDGVNWSNVCLPLLAVPVTVLRVTVWSL